MVWSQSPFCNCRTVAHSFSCLLLLLLLLWMLMLLEVLATRESSSGGSRRQRGGGKTQKKNFFILIFYYSPPSLKNLFLLSSETAFHLLPSHFHLFFIRFFLLLFPSCSFPPCCLMVTTSWMLSSVPCFSCCTSWASLSSSTGATWSQSGVVGGCCRCCRWRIARLILPWGSQDTELRVCWAR